MQTKSSISIEGLLFVVLVIAAAIGLSKSGGDSPLNREDEYSIVEGVKITGTRQRILVDQAYAMQERLINLSGSRPDRIPEDDWNLFREVLNDPSKLSNTKHIAALIRLMRNLDDSRLKEVLKELLCSALPEICQEMDAEPTNEQQQYRGKTMNNLDMSVRLYNGLADFYRLETQLHNYGDTPLERILELLKKAGNGFTAVGFLKARNMGKRSLREFEELVKDEHPDLYEEYFEQ